MMMMNKLSSSVLHCRRVAATNTILNPSLAPSIFPALFQLRSYTSAPSGGRGSKLGGGKPKLYNLKGVIHPYAPAFYRQQMANRPLSITGMFSDRFRLLVNWYKKWTSFFVAYRRLGKEEFNPRTFATTKAVAIYKDLYHSMYKKDWSGISKNATQEGERFYKNLVRDNQVQLAHWNCDEVKSAKIVHASAVDGQQMKAYIIQVTVHLVTVETVTEKNAKMGQTGDFERYLVFERNATDINVPWKVVGEVKAEDVTGTSRGLSKLV